MQTYTDIHTCKYTYTHIQTCKHTDVHTHSFTYIHTTLSVRIKSRSEELF